MTNDDDIQEYVRPWKGLTDKEMLEALRVVDAGTAVTLLIGRPEMPPAFVVFAHIWVIFDDVSDWPNGMPWPSHLVSVVFWLHSIFWPA